MSKRIEYIDAIRGFSIIWVFLFHFQGAGHFVYDWMYVPYRIPLFFLYSGIFFRLNPFKEFLTKKINTLLIPFIVFWVVGLTYSIIKNVFVLQLILGKDTSEHFSLIEHLTAFKHFVYFHSDVNPVMDNTPLWFLLVLFFIQLIHYINLKFIKNKIIILCVAFVLYISGQILYIKGITMFFYAYIVFAFYIYYLIGHFYGHLLIKHIENKLTQLSLLLICASLLISLTLLGANFSIAVNQFLFEIRTLCFCVLIFIFFRYYSKIKFSKVFKVLKFFGLHSLEFLVTHRIIISIWFDFKYYILNKHFINLDGMLIYDIIVLILILTIEYFIIKLLNRFVPKLIGRKNLLPINQKV